MTSAPTEARTEAGAGSGPTGRSELLWPPLFAVALFAGWELASRAGLVAAYLLPPFSDVARALLYILGDRDFLAQLGATVLAIAIAFLVASPVSVATGLLLGQLFHRAARVNAAMNVMLGVPQSIFLPLFVLVLGVSMLEKVVFGFTPAFFVIVVVTTAAVRSVPAPLVTAARVFGANDRQIVWHVYLPAMMPLILTGLRIGLIFAVGGVLTAEIFASRNGVGHLLFLWMELAEMENLLATVLVLSAGTIAINETLRLLERRAWRQESSAWNI